MCPQRCAAQQRPRGSYPCRWHEEGIYHDWAFDGTGRIADIPTQKGADAGRWPKRSVQRSYRVAFEDGDLVVYDAESVSA